jgi:hypothetical protein
VNQKKRNNEKTESEDALCYSIFISFPLGFDCSLFLNVISRIPLLNTDLAVSISVSSGKSITSRYFLGPVVVTSTEWSYRILSVCSLCLHPAFPQLP